MSHLLQSNTLNTMSGRVSDRKLYVASILVRKNPVGIWCQNAIVSTSMRRHHVASTFIRRHFTSCPLGRCSETFLSNCHNDVHLEGHWDESRYTSLHRVCSSAPVRGREMNAETYVWTRFYGRVWRTCHTL